ncbi:extracellular solute-binding protein [Rhodovulum viride]|nr:extracellular solute-binding protein [Rhodovulum viride]
MIRPLAALALTAALAQPLALHAQTAPPAGPASTAQGVVTSHGISTFGDLKYPAGFAHFDYVVPDAPKGGTMSFRGTGASRTFDSLNMFILAGEPAQGMELIYDSLLAPSFDEPDAAYGLLAESVTFPPDRSWAVFRLRPEARFADGSPVTAADVVFTFLTLQQKGAPLYRMALRDLASAEALSPTEVRIAFAEGAPTRDLIGQLGQLPILPAHFYDAVPFERSSLEPPLGSGPYVVSKVEPGKAIAYCRNPAYWAADLPVNVGKDNFDCYRYEYYADETGAFEAFKSGGYIFQEEFSSAIWATAYDFPAVARGWVKRDELPDARPSGAQGFWFNLRRPQFADPRVREAIAMMFNFEWANETLFYGLYQRTDSFWENTALQAEGLPEGAELAVLEKYRDRLPETVFTEPAVSPPVHDAARNLDRRTLRAAGRLLDEAGWTVDDRGQRRDASGQALRVEFVSDSPVFERIVLPYLANLQQLGIEAVNTTVDAAQMQQRLEDFDYDITSTRFVLSLSPSIELRSLFGSEEADAKGSYNLSGLKDPVVDALIEEVIAAPDRDALDVRVRALDRVLRARHIWVPNWYSGKHRIAYWDVFGRPETKPPYDRGVEFWWWDQARYEALRSAGALR